MSLKRSSGITSPIAAGLGSAACSGTNPARRKATMVAQCTIGTLNTPGRGALNVRTMVVMVTAWTAAVQPRGILGDLICTAGLNLTPTPKHVRPRLPCPPLLWGGRPGAVDHIHHLPQAA